MSAATTQAAPSAIGKLTALFPKTPEGKPKFITEPEEFNATMERLSTSGLCNLLGAIQYVDYIPPVQAVSLRVILSRPDMWYAPRGWGNGGEALRGEALAILFREAGGSYRPSARTDDGSDRFYCSMMATVVIRSMSGLDATFSKPRELDLRPGAPEAAGMTEKQLPQAQQTILRVCDTKAQLRAIRAALGVPQAFAKDQARLPFVIPTLVPNPDMSNPLHANFMLAHSMGAVESLYGRKPLPAHGGEAEVLHVDSMTGEVIDVAVDVSAPEQSEGLEPGLDDEIPPAGVAFACCCPCGCRAAISEQTATFTMARRKGARCTACWPGSQFDHDRHKNLGSLGLDPDVAPRDVRRK